MRANPWLHRYALLLALFGLAVIVSGAVITSTAVAARQSQSAVSAALDAAPHKALAIALAALTLGFSIWTSLSAAPGRLRALAWTACAVLAADAAVGWSTPPLAPTRGIFHALLAHLYLSIMVGIAAVTSAGWNREPELAGERGWPSLRPIAIATPPAVFLQITLGAAY